jgi:hypothetical protein
VRRPRKPWSGSDTVAMASLAAASLTLSAAVIIRRPDLVKGAEFLFQDAGHNLLVAERLLAGASLYSDVFYPYGPIPAYLHAVVAWIFGNTPTTYLSLLAGLSVVNICLTYALIRRAAGGWTAVAIGVVMLAVLPIPGAIVGAFTSSPFLVLERTLLLLVALSWRPPTARSLTPSLAMGIALGVWQGVKFGGAVVAGAAVLLLGVAHLVSTGFSVCRVKAWTRTLAVTVVAFIGAEFVWVSYAFLALPYDVAVDVVWPSYMFHAYWVVPPDIRWPTWGGWRLMVAQYLLPLTAGLLGVFGFVGWLRATRREAAADIGTSQGVGSVFVPLCFYAVACIGYFNHVYHFHQFLWALVPASAWLLPRLPPAATFMTALAWTPGLLVVLRSAFVTISPPSVVTVHLPSGGSIVTTASMATRIAFLERFTTSESGGRPILYVPCGSGWHYAYAVPAATRNTFFFAPEVIRPYERQEFLRSLDRTAALITCDQPSSSPPLDTIFRLDPSIADAIYSRLEPWTTEAGCRVFRIRRLVSD